MKPPSRLPDSFRVLPAGMYPVGKQHDDEFRFWIDPDRGAGEAGMAEGRGREQVPGIGRR